MFFMIGIVPAESPATSPAKETGRTEDGEAKGGQRGDYYSVEYPPSSQEGELPYGVLFKI